MMDINDIDIALHEIKQMVLVAIVAAENLVGSDTEPGFFLLSETDTDLLSFSIFDIQRRVDKLKAELVMPTATVVRIGSNECA